jgi:hypothetical protein
MEMNPILLDEGEKSYHVPGIGTLGKLYLAIALLGIILLSVQTEAAQFEGSNLKLPIQQPIDSEMEADQVVKSDQAASTQQNATNLNQSSIAMLTTLNVEVASDVYSEKDRHVLYCPKGNYMVVRNRIYLVGADLDKVKQVKYLLHPSFSNPVAVSEDPTNSFEAWIWSWGGFPIKATITTKTGQVFEKDFDFTFKTKFEEAQSKGIPQAMECNE